MARRLTLDYLRTQSGAGLVLAIAAAGAVVAANSPWADNYKAILAAPIPVRLGDFAPTLSLSSWVADGLMAIFFLVVGMELKFEVLRGELVSPRRLALPAFAAAGGVVVPALVYLAFNLGSGGAPAGWPTAIATDLAFALAALAFAAPNAPGDLRVFLLSLAIADDLFALGSSALLFHANIRPAAIAGAVISLAALGVVSRWRRTPFLFYAVGFALVWGFTLESGLNTSLAGVACAMTVPVGARRAGQESVLKFFMDSLHPYVAYGVLPLFAFTAAGFSISGVGGRRDPSLIELGLILALAVGKPVGVFGFSVLATLARVARRPAGATWLELFGVSLLTGMGFTASLFFGRAAFAGAPAAAQDQARMAIIVGSLIAMLAGAVVLVRAKGLRRAQADEQRG